MNYVIGSGLSGLIAGYILDWPVIGKDIGGQMKSPFPLGPRILEAAGESTWLIAKLGIQVPPMKEYTIGYKDKDGNVHDEPDHNFRAAYYAKTRLENDQSFISIPESIMTGGRKRLIGWDMEQLQLVQKLRSRVAIIPSNIINIFTSRKTLVLEDGTELKYDNLLSTIPLPTLNNLIGSPLERDLFKAFDTVFVEASSYDEIYSPTDYKDYVYVANHTIPHHRITRIGLNTYVYEYRADRYSGCFYSDPLYFKPMYKHIVKNCQIAKDLKLDSLLGIKLIGRYAEWYHGHKTEDVIRRSLDYANEVGAIRE
jgi:hypothetical protein